MFLDGIDNGHLMFNAKGYVSSPRSAYGVRSALLFEILGRLAGAGLDMAPPSTMLLRTEPGAEPPRPPETSAAAPQ